MTGDPARLAQQILELRGTIDALEEQHQALRDELKHILLGEATEPPPGGWVYGAATVQYVKAQERPKLNRAKLVQQGVSLDQIVKATDYTKMPPTIRVVRTGEKAAEQAE